MKKVKLIAKAFFAGKAKETTGDAIFCTLMILGQVTMLYALIKLAPIVAVVVLGLMAIGLITVEAIKFAGFGKMRKIADDVLINSIYVSWTLTAGLFVYPTYTQLALMVGLLVVLPWLTKDKQWGFYLDAVLSIVVILLMCINPFL